MNISQENIYSQIESVNIFLHKSIVIFQSKMKRNDRENGFCLQNALLIIE